MSDQQDQTAEATAKAPDAAKEDDGPKMAEDGLPEIFTEDDLSVLSDAEIAEIRAMQEEDAAAEADAPAEAQQPAAEAESAPDDTTQTVPDDQEPQTIVELPPIPDTSEAKAALEEIDGKIDEIKEMFKDGDIDEDEYADQLTQIAAQRAEHDAAIKAAEAIERQHQERHEQDLRAWYSKTEAFMEAHPSLKSDEHLPGFDAALKFVTSSFPNMDADAQIELAFQNYAQAAAAAGTPLPDAPAPSAKQPDGKKVEVKSGDPELPPTIAAIPATDISAGEDGQFATLDRIVDSPNPYAAEDALARLSEEQMEAYLARG